MTVRTAGLAHRPAAPYEPTPFVPAPRASDLDAFDDADQLTPGYPSEWSQTISEALVAWTCGDIRDIAFTHPEMLAAASVAQKARMVERLASWPCMLRDERAIAVVFSSCAPADLRELLITIDTQGDDTTVEDVVYHAIDDEQVRQAVLRTLGRAKDSGEVAPAVPAERMGQAEPERVRHQAPPGKDARKIGRAHV